MKDIKKIKRKIFATTMIITILFSAILWTIPTTRAQNGDVPASTLDVKITNITFSNDGPVEGEEIRIYANVLNNGTQSANNITITFYVDSEAIANTTDTTINANESITVNCTWIAEKWSHNISVMISNGNIPLTNTRIANDIYVDATPIGNIQSLILALVVIFIIVIGTSFIPSTWESVINLRTKVRK